MGTHPEKTACVRGLAQAKTRCVNCPPQVQEPGVGTHPERTACVRGSNADTNTVRDLPTAGVPTAGETPCIFQIEKYREFLIAACRLNKTPGSTRGK